MSIKSSDKINSQTSGIVIEKTFHSGSLHYKLTLILHKL